VLVGFVVVLSVGLPSGRTALNAASNIKWSLLGKLRLLIKGFYATCKLDSVLMPNLAQLTFVAIW